MNQLHLFSLVDYPCNKLLRLHGWQSIQHLLNLHRRCQVEAVVRCSSILFLAISKYLSSFSMPMKLRFVLTQATPVLPLPMQLSKTVSFSFVYVFIKYSKRSTGFCVESKTCLPQIFANFKISFGKTVKASYSLPT